MSQTTGERNTVALSRPFLRLAKNSSQSVSACLKRSFFSPQ